MLDVQRPLPGLIVHQVRVLSDELAAGDSVHAAAPEWRLGARQACSGTHVLHAALRQVLGPGAPQSGSYNRPGYLRLDFPWRGALSPTVRGEIEEAADQALRRDLPVGVRWMTLPEAKELGALALFDETYGEKVRVVEIGGAWSRELCGGTHVEHASQIGTVALTSESSVGAGMCRLEAAVGIEGFGYLARERDPVTRIAEQLQAPRAELPDRVAGLPDRLKSADRENQRIREQADRARASDLKADATDVDGTPVVTATRDGDAQALAIAVRDRLPAARPGERHSPKGNGVPAPSVPTHRPGGGSGTPMSAVSLISTRKYLIAELVGARGRRARSHRTSNRSARGSRGSSSGGGTRGRGR